VKATEDAWGKFQVGKLNIYPSRPVQMLSLYLGRWAGAVACLERMRTAFGNLRGNPEGKGLLEKHKITCYCVTRF